MVVRLENIQKSYPTGFLMNRRRVLEGLSLHLQPQDAYGLLGGNGAGKSTTLRILLGLSRPDGGTGLLFGRPLGDHDVGRRVGYLPETPTFHEQLTGSEFLRFCGQLLGLRGRALGERVDALLDRVQLDSARDQRLRKMSKGMLQRLGLAQALLGDPELLVLDEPMSGLDPQGRKLVRDLILEQRGAGKTVLFSTHILSDVELVCTRAGILRGGRLGRELHLQDLGRLGNPTVEVQVTGLPESAVGRLGERTQGVLRSGDRVLFTVEPGGALHRLVRSILDFGGELQSVVPRRASLEEIFVGETCTTGSSRERVEPSAPGTAPSATTAVGGRT